MNYTCQLRLGTRLHAHGDDYLVTGLAGPRVVLISEDDAPKTGRLSTWLLAEIVQAPDFRVLGVEYDPDVAHSIFSGVDHLPPDVARAAIELAEHIREAETGYRSGSPLTRRRYEPRPHYDPTKVPRITDRLRQKANDLGIGLRQMQRYRARLKHGGVPALVDGRRLAPTATRDLDPRVRKAMEAIRKQIKQGETLDLKRIRTHVIAWLRVNYPDCPILGGDSDGLGIEILAPAGPAAEDAA